MNNNPEQQNSVKDSVLEKIKAENTRMHTRSYFVLKVCASVVVTLFVLVLSIAICNFIFFSLRINGPGSLLGLGLPGLLVFLELFPWALLLLDVICIAILERLLRQFRFGYRSPFIYLLLGTLVVVVSLSFLIDRLSGVNDNLLHRADQHQLPPPFGNFLEGERRPPPPGSGIYKATVVSINGNELGVELFGTTTPVTITLPPNDPALMSLHIGDVLLVAAHGGMASTSIHADSIRPLPALAMPPP